MFSFYFKKEAPNLLVNTNQISNQMKPIKYLEPLLTLSTCWYNIKSKFPSAKYLEWANWIKNHETSSIDLHKKIDWKLNMLWCEKVHFVNETVTNKYFNTLFYGWCDIGYFRNNDNNMHTSQLSSWPNSAKLLDDAFLKKGIHYGCIQNNPAIFNSLQEEILIHYKNQNKENKEKIGHPTNKLLNNCFAGGFFIIRPTLMQGFASIFDSKLQYYFNNEYVIKDDQTILLDCIFTNPQLFGIHWDHIHTKYDNWFMFQHMLN
jgi:hypothetical protein